MKQIIKLIFLFIPVLSFAQTNVIDEFSAKIKTVVEDPNSEYYYSKLQEKVKSSSSQITVDDSYYLYYGKIYNYNTLINDLYYMELIFKFKDAIEEKDYQNAYSIGKSVLEKDPAELCVLFGLAKAINDKKIDDCCNIVNRCNNMIKAIISTGTGKNPNEAIFLINGDQDVLLEQFKIDPIDAEQSSGDNENDVYSVFKYKGKSLYLNFINL
jgi:hypothetical protein